MEIYRVSPDIASTGFASNWFQRLIGMAVALIAISVGACRLAHSGQRTDVMRALGTQPYQSGLHNSFAVLILLAIGATWCGVETIRAWVFPYGVSFADVFAYFFRDPMSLLYLAVCLLSLQFAWVRWRRRNDKVAWRITALDRNSFACNWLALAALVVVGIPTINAYCFVFWLGPWYLYGQ